MIKAILNHESRIIAPTLPEVGDTIHVENFGHALVESITNDGLDNFIQLEFQETIIGKYSQRHRFTACAHDNQYVNDRSQFVCNGCGEELGR